jgi:hypothetical protein
MTGIGRKPRPPIAARRLGYLIAAAINGVFLYLINVNPGWQAVPFLTEDTNYVLGLVNFSILATIAANLLYVIYDARWWRATGDLVTTGIGLIVLTRMWSVFPFDFSDSAFDWTFLARLLLVIAMVGAIIGMVVQLVLLVRLAAGRDDDRSERRVGSGV